MRLRPAPYFRPRGQAQLLLDVAEVRHFRGQRHAHSRGNLFVRETLVEPAQEFALPGGQLHLVLATLRYQFQCHRAPLIEKTGAILFIYNACTARHKPPNAVSSKWGYGIDAQKGIVIKHIRQRLIDPETGKLTAAPQDAAILSRRERLIVFLLACGETIKEIAYSLSVSTSTITGHAKHLRQGLRIHTQALLTRWAMSHSRAKAGAAVGIKQHPEGCTCGEPFCTYARGAGEDIASIPPDADPDPKT